MRAVVSTEFIADGVTPIAAYHCAVSVRPGPSFLLESAPGPQATSRYSIIGLGNLGEVQAVDGTVSLRAGNVAREYGRTGVLTAARDLLQLLSPAAADAKGAARFLGAYGAAAFEFAGYFERLPQLPRDGDPMPDLHLVVPETIVVFDHFSHRAVVATLADGVGAARPHDDVVAAVQGASIGTLARTPARQARAVPSALPFTDAVERAKEAIFAGEAFQIVLSRRWEVQYAGDPFDAYRALRSINPSPYMFYVDFGWGRLFGSSPEVLVRVDGRRASLRPLAGTRPRDPDPARDRRLASALKRDAKERAEHVMLVDLGRNDLGRTCVAGSVRVSDLLAVEYYSHVMHLVSEVRGTVQRSCDAFDVFAAAFPAGTVSGAPKIRAMELIAELEGARRGFYAGSVGYFGFDGSMDACITLRSAHATGDRCRVQAGAGIVADSDPASEERECAAKARAVLEALGSTAA